MSGACAIPKPRTPCSIHVPLHEHETAKDEFSSWPPAVQAIHTREIDLWCSRNPDLDLVEQSHSIDPVRKITVTEFHYADKAAVAP